MWTCDSFADMGCGAAAAKDVAAAGHDCVILVGSGGADVILERDERSRAFQGGGFHAECGSGARRADVDRAEPGARGMRGGSAEAGRAAAAGGHRGQAAEADGDRLRRICRALHRGRTRSRSARAFPAISRRSHFKDGQIVKQGDLLFTIDRRPFETALAQVRATLAQARANLAYHRKRPRPRLAAGARPHHHGADLRAAHAGQARRRSLRGGAGGRGAPGRARPAVHRAEGAG